MPNTKFNAVVSQVRQAVAEATGYSVQSSKDGGDLELINALVAKALIALTPAIVEYVKRPLGQG